MRPLILALCMVRYIFLSVSVSILVPFFAQKSSFFYKLIEFFSVFFVGVMLYVSKIFHRFYWFVIVGAFMILTSIGVAMMIQRRN